MVNGSKVFDVGIGDILKSSPSSGTSRFQVLNAVSQVVASHLNNEMWIIKFEKWQSRAIYFTRVLMLCLK